MNDCGDNTRGNGSTQLNNIDVLDGFTWKCYTLLLSICFWRGDDERRHDHASIRSDSSGVSVAVGHIDGLVWSPAGCCGSHRVKLFVYVCVWSRWWSDRAAVTSLWLRELKGLVKCWGWWHSSSTCLHFVLWMCVCVCVCVCQRESTSQLNSRFPVTMPTTRGCSCWSMLSLAPSPVTIASEGAHTRAHTHTLSLTLLQLAVGARRRGEAACCAAVLATHKHRPPNTHSFITKVRTQTCTYRCECPGCSVLFRSVPFRSVLFHSVLFCSVPFCSVPFRSVLFWMWGVCSISVCDRRGCRVRQLLLL